MNDELSASGHEPKISLVEILLITPYVLLIDAVEIVLVFFAIDDFWILDLMGIPLGIYIFLKGIRATRYVATYILELIPYVGSLPLLTLGWILTIALDRNPQLETAVAVVGAAKGGVKGAREAGTEAGAMARGKAAVKGAREGAQEARGVFDEKAPESSGGMSSSNNARGEKSAKNTGEGLAEEETKRYNMPVEPLSQLETKQTMENIAPFERKYMTENPHPFERKQMTAQLKPFERRYLKQNHNPNEENVILNGNEIDLRDEKETA